MVTYPRRNRLYLVTHCRLHQEYSVVGTPYRRINIGNNSHPHKEQSQINKEPTERSALFDCTIGGTEYRRQGVLFYKLSPSQESVLVLIRKEDTPMGCPLVFILLRIHYITFFGAFSPVKFPRLYLAKSVKAYCELSQGGIFSPEQLRLAYV